MCKNRANRLMAVVDCHFGNSTRNNAIFRLAVYDNFSKEEGMGVENDMSRRVVGCTKRRVWAWSARRCIGEAGAP